MNVKPVILPLSVVVAVTVVVGSVMFMPGLVGTNRLSGQPAQQQSAAGDDIAAVVDHLDRFFESRWRKAGLIPAEPADDLVVLRRLSLALHGTIPSLEEIRAFEADTRPDRLDRRTRQMLADPRFADYFAERLARAYVGTDGGQFLIYRRDRFTDWLSEQLAKNRSYDQIVGQMVSADGLWTGRPATNFVTATVNEGQPDVDMLTGRSVRAFLGQRIDCAQCHDHPFDEWTQAQYQGLAAFFGQIRISIAGVEDRAVVDGKRIEYEVEDILGEEKRVVEPQVPFHPEWLPETGSRREKLAAWMTHPDNRRFGRAIANRVWGYLFGRPYVTPVDDLPDPVEGRRWSAESRVPLLDILGDDFRRHGCNLRRLIRVIAASRPFRLASTHPADGSDLASRGRKPTGSGPEADASGSPEFRSDSDVTERLLEHHAVFRLTRLRPEQIIGSMLQAGSVKTIDQNSHLVVRLIRFFRENDFVKEYGDLGEAELEQGPGTLPQALMRMNGKLPDEILDANPFTASGRIAAVAGSDETCLEICFLVCLTRRPTAREQAVLLPHFERASTDGRKQAVEDLYWALFNSAEFAWNH